MKALDTVRVGAKAVFALADLVLGRLPGPRILIYHQVGAGLGRQMEVTKEAFRSHLDWLGHHGRVVDLETAISRKDHPDGHSHYVLTFDDGYEDLHRVAFPLLEAARLPFTLYLATHPVESQEPLTPGGRADPLTWGQIREMLASGLMTLGVHTHRHLDLRKLAEEEIHQELEVSDRLVEERTGVPARHFAYPWGYWSAQADAQVRRRYVSAVLGSGPPNDSRTEPFLLHRIPVQLADGVFFFRRKMRTGLRLEDRVRRRVTGYQGP